MNIFKVVLFAKIVEQGGIVFVNDNHRLLVASLVSIEHQFFQASSRRGIVACRPVKLGVSAQLAVKLGLELRDGLVFSCRKVEIKHRKRNPFIDETFGCKPFE